MQASPAYPELGTAQSLLVSFKKRETLDARCEKNQTSSPLMSAEFSPKDYLVKKIPV